MKFIARNFMEAGGFLKEIQWRDIDYLPVTCSHIDAAVNIIDGGVAGMYN